MKSEMNVGFGATFLTGGTGFLGLVLLRRLLEAGITDIRACVRSTASQQKIENIYLGKVKSILCAIDEEHMNEIIAGMRGCDVVFHCAAFVDDWGSRDEAIHTNRDGTRVILRAAYEAGVRRVVHVSTEALLSCGDPIVNADEDTPIPFGRHLGIYSETKAMAEVEVHAAVQTLGMDAVIVRPRLIWGPEGNVVDRIVGTVKAGRWVWVDNGNQLTSTCHVENCVTGMFLAADRSRDTKGRTYFLTDGAPIAQRKLVSDLCGVYGIERVDGLHLPLSLVMWAAYLEETWCYWMGGKPGVSRMGAALFLVEVTVNDARARAELGYGTSTPLVTWDEGIVDMKKKVQRSALG